MSKIVDGAQRERFENVECRLSAGLPRDAEIIRRSVFIEEQGFQNEFDEIDAHAVHAVIYVVGERAATGRLYGGTDKMTIGRVAVLKDFRGGGLGRAVIENLEQKARGLGAAEISLSAQVRVKEFYERLGYVATDECSDDEGVPHVKMIKAL